MLDPVTISLLLTCLGGVVWAIRLEGKVSENKQLVEGRLNEHDQLFEERKAQSDERQNELKSRLIRIEEKLDKIAYGTLGKS